MKNSFILNNGNKIPKVGLGTYRLSDEDLLKETIHNALSIGYRHIDTAFKYNNEEKIVNILKNLFKNKEYNRNDLFITSKMWCTEIEPIESVQESLKKLKTNYLDLYLIHFPVTFTLNEEKMPFFDENGFYVHEEYKIEEIWRKMEKLVEEGLTKSIGVSNFGINTLKRILKICKIKPAVNQIEIHPYLQQKEMIDFCVKNDILIVGHSTLGGSATKKEDAPVLLNDEVLNSISKKYKVTSSKIILSWLVQKNICVIPKSTKYDHLKDNFELIYLEKEDFDKIEGIKKTYRFNHPNYFKMSIYE